MTSPPRPRVSWVVVVVLVVALSVGAAASILVAASTAPPPAPGPASLVILPSWALPLAGLALLGAVVGSLVLWRLTSQPSSTLNRGAVTLLVAILVGVLFVIGARALGFGGPVSSGSGGSVGGGNTTTGPGNATGGTNVTGSGGTLYFFPNLPGWVPIVVLGAVALVVVIVGVPMTSRYLSERRARAASRSGSETKVPAGVREALGKASAELDLGQDPRLVILALYGEMLLRLRPMVGGVETSTPEEVRAAHLIRLGVRPEAAETLTRLFEEARYSTHPMGPEKSERAKKAVRETLEDLDRGTTPA